MTRWFISVAALIAGLSTLYACGGEGGVRPGSGSNGTGQGTNGGSGGGGTATSAAGGTGGSGMVIPEVPGVPEAPDACDESALGGRLLRRLTNRELTNTYAAVFPEAAAQVTTELPPDVQGSVRLTNDASTLTMGSQMAEAITARAEEIARLVTAEPALSTRFPCAAAADEACATRFIDTYGSALFRRPLSDGERSRYLELFLSISGRADSGTGLMWVLVALMQSPHTVYRSELGVDGQLSPYEIASELSYDYSASPPSAELISLAESGGLADPETRVAQARQLLGTPGGEQVIQQFFSEWLWYTQAGSANRANAPDNFPTIRAKMVLETQRFINQVVTIEQGGVADLLTANYTIADTELGTYYGLNGGTGDLYQGGGVPVTRNEGVGILAQGSVLTTMASVQITSPTRRGLLLLKRLYCEVPGLPQALNFDLTRSEVQGNTTRERLESSHLAGACQSCHSQFDPLGFAFESFDHVGRYRTEEQTAAGAFPVNTTTAVEKLDGQVISGQEELMQLISQDPEVLSCISATLERYVYGSEGSCRAKEARSKVMAGQISVIDFLAELAREPHFTARR
jgi:hypothetical protein